MLPSFPTDTTSPSPTRHSHDAHRLLTIAALLSLLALIGPLAHPFGPVRQALNDTPLFSGTDVPANVLTTFENKCADCHSQRTRWPFYSHVAPASWLLERDVAIGRQHLDASAWSSYSVADRLDYFSKIARETRNRTMPPPQYLLIHRGAKLTPPEAAEISAWAKLARRNLQAGFEK